jgi:hypothetical protein
MSEDSKELAAAIYRLAEVHEEKFEAIAQALDRVGKQLSYLGTGNAQTEMGAVEMLAEEVKKGFATLANALERDD